MRVISGTARGTHLNSIDNDNTRPTLDRVKESLFNIINNRIDEESVVLDLFSGSGSIGIEFLSRGAKQAVLCDISKEAAQMINQNIKKTRLEDRAKVINQSYDNALKYLKSNNYKFNFIYLDPPYKKNLAVKAVEMISEFNLLDENGIIIIETDEKERELEELKNINIKYKLSDLRKYGRASLIFLDFINKDT